MHAILERNRKVEVAVGAALAALLAATPAARADAGANPGANATATSTAVARHKTAPTDPDTVVINFMGDVSYPSGWGGWRYIDQQKSLLFRQVQRIFDSADLNFANIECPITDSEATAKKRFPIRCKPRQIPYFINAGIDLFSLANNHSIDVGSVGLDDTIENLKKIDSDQAPLWWAGIGTDRHDAAVPAHFTVPGKHVVVALIAVANTSGRGRVAGFHDPDLPARVTAAAKSSDIVIVSSHYGPEYEHVPWSSAVKRYHEMIDAGATMVVAHHPHVVQGVERYHGGVIFYSQGNFSFGSKTRRHLEKGARMYSTIGRVTFHDGKLARVEIIPLYANNMAPWILDGKAIDPRHAEPQLLAGPFAKYALDEFVDFAHKIPGAEKTHFIRVGDRMFVNLGKDGFDEAERARLIARQKREYQAVLDAGVGPRTATEAENHRNQRAGTPWPPRPPAPKSHKRGKSRKAHGKRHHHKRAGKRSSSRRKKH